MWKLIFQNDEKWEIFFYIYTTFSSKWLTNDYTSIRVKNLIILVESNSKKKNLFNQIKINDAFFPFAFINKKKKKTMTYLQGPQVANVIE